MEPLYSNRTTLDKALCEEFLKYMWKRSAGFLRWIMYAGTVLSAGFAVYVLVAYGLAVGWFTALLLVVMGAFCFFLARYGYLLRASGFVKTQQKVWKANSLVKEYAFCEDGIHESSKLGSDMFKYKDVLGFSTSGDLVVLQLKRASMLLQRSGFDEGTYESFEEFIQGKIRKNTKKK